MAKKLSSVELLQQRARLINLLSKSPIGISTDFIKKNIIDIDLESIKLKRELRIEKLNKINGLDSDNKKS